MKRQKILFKINNEVIVEETNETISGSIDEIKHIIVEETDCKFEEITVEYIDLPSGVSEDIDVSDIGMIFWKDLDFVPITGVVLDLVEGSDDYLDAVFYNDFEKYLRFI